VLDIDTDGNDLALIALSIMELNVDDDFLSKLKWRIPCVAISPIRRNYNGRGQICDIVRRNVPVSPTCCDPPSGKASKKALILELYDDVGHHNYRRLMISLLKRYQWDKIAFNCKLYFRHCVVCKRARPDRKGGVALQPLGVSQYPWEIVGIDYVTDLPKIVLMVTHMPLLWFVTF
jgi:hypothetical protein